MEEPEGGRKCGFGLKRHMQIYVLRPHTEAVRWKKHGLDQLGEILGKTEGNWHSLWGWGWGVAATFGGLFYYKDTNAGKYHFEIFLLVVSTEGLPAHKGAGNSTRTHLGYALSLIETHCLPTGAWYLLHSPEVPQPVLLDMRFLSVSWLRHGTLGPFNQLHQDPALSTRGQAAHHVRQCLAVTSPYRSDMEHLLST